jgi:hypothetical protein
MGNLGQHTYGPGKAHPHEVTTICDKRVPLWLDFQVSCRSVTVTVPDQGGRDCHCLQLEKLSRR